LDDLAQGIKEQVDIGRVMDIGFDHKGVTACCQRFFFFNDWPARTTI
jgi:hypothetical protein